MTLCCHSRLLKQLHNFHMTLLQTNKLSTSGLLVYHSHITCMLHVVSLSGLFALIKQKNTFFQKITTTTTTRKKNKNLVQLQYLQFNSKFLFDFTFNQIHPFLLQFIRLVMKLLLHFCQIFGDGFSHNTIHPLKEVRTFGEH